MSRLCESGILGDIPTEELVKESEDSDMWKDAVGHKFQHNNFISFIHLYPGAKVEPILAAADCLR
jgi:hypothetical protein